MPDSNGDPKPSETLPDDLVERVDALDLPGLEALRSYVDRRIESIQPPLEREIRANAAGEVLEVENHEGYALVRQHPPEVDGSGVHTDVTNAYHVRRERHPDGETSLHWSYIGDVHASERVWCADCGRTLDADVEVCPHCGSEAIVHADSRE